jgi:hypothetical protein
MRNSRTGWSGSALSLALVAGSKLASAERLANRTLRNERRAALQERAEELRDQGQDLPGMTDADSGPGTANLAADIPAGTNALITLDSALDSSEQGAGTEFVGTLQADRGNDSPRVALRGSQGYGNVVSARQPLNVVGQSSLELQLTGLMVGDQLRPIESSTLAVESGRTGGDTLRKKARAAAIGGMADGSEGAETGARIGGPRAC